MVFGYIGSKNDGPRVPVMLLVGRAQCVHQVALGLRHADI